MTGRLNFNRDAFIDAESLFCLHGHEVVNPWRLGAVKGWRKHDYMKRDIAELAKCDGIYMLPGWLRSWGAKREYLVARFVFGLRRIR